MNFTQSFRLAVKSLIASKMRALLTMLGIIIGVAAVIVITSLGNGMQNYMNRQFDQLGANLIQVQIWGLGGMSSRTVDPDDMYALVDKYPQYLSGVSPYVMTQGLTPDRYWGYLSGAPPECVRHRQLSGPGCLRRRRPGAVHHHQRHPLHRHRRHGRVRRQHRGQL